MDELKTIIKGLQEIRTQLKLDKLDDNTLSDIASRIYISDRIGNKQAKSQNITPEVKEIAPKTIKTENKPKLLSDRQYRLLMKAKEQGAYQESEYGKIEDLTSKRAWEITQELMGR
jgi:hypothetical protein